MGWKRARTKEQKEQRISGVMDAAARLYERQGFEGITFASIAEEAGFTRSNLYKYFSSKEEIFLKFLEQDMVRWRQDLVMALQEWKVYSVGEFASVWVKVQGRHGRMLHLISILYDQLEKSSSLESLIDFNTMTKEELKILSELICDLFPSLHVEDAVKFLNMYLAASIGFYKMTNLSEVQQEVLALTEFQHLKMDYDAYFQQAVEYLLLGLLADS